MGLKQRGIDKRTTIGTDLLIFRDLSAASETGEAIAWNGFVYDVDRVEILEVGVSCAANTGGTSFETRVDSGNDAANFSSGVGFTNVYTPSGTYRATVNQNRVDDRYELPIQVAGVAMTVSNTGKKGVNLRVVKYVNGTATASDTTHWVRYRAYRSMEA